MSKKKQRSVHVPASLQGSITEAIADARKKARLSRAELSHRLGRSSNFIQKIESGMRDVSVAEFVVIIKATGADPSEVLRRALKE